MHFFFKLGGIIHACISSIINLLENIVCCAITFLYHKRNRKTRLARLWCDIAVGKCYENSREEF